MRARGAAAPSFDERDLSDKPGFVARRDPIDEGTLEKIDRSYRCGLAALLSVDDAVAGLVAELGTAGRLKSTTIVFTADQGILAGEHRLLGKNLPYEEAIRVPLVVRSPGVRAGTVNAEPVVNADLAPTILELAGVGVLTSSRGCSTAFRCARRCRATSPWPGERSCSRAQGGGAGTPDSRCVPTLACGPRATPTSSIGARG